MSEQQVSGADTRSAAETLDLAVKGAKAYGRDDLAQRLLDARHLLSGQAINVYVVGEFKQGKSSLINALLAAPICPVDDDVATAVPTEVRYSEEPRAIARYAPENDRPRADSAEEIPVQEIARYVSEAGNPGNVRRLRSVSVGVDRKLLSGGLVLVDTPGVGGLGSVHNAVTVGSLPRAHAVMFVSDASQELTGPEIKFLRTVAELCPTILFVMTKTDLYPQWRRIAELNLGHLKRHAVQVQAIAVSSTLRAQAVQADDQELNRESGFPDLVTWVQRVIRDAEGVALQSVSHHILSAVGQLDALVRSRKAALEHPERSAELLETLSRARDRADRLRSQSSRWQQILNDGFADIASDVDFDLRSRIRVVVADAEKGIDEGDPAAGWEEFENWLRQRVAAETLENYGLLVRSVRELAVRVAEHFELSESSVITPLGVAPPVDVLDGIETDRSFARAKRLAGGAAGFQKAYMGLLMAKMLPLMAGLVVPLPLVAVAGVAMGGAGMRAGRKQALEKRRGQAKTTVRRFVDEFNLQVGKDSKDSLRRLQRELRDGYSSRAEELQRSTAESLGAAQAAVRSDETDAKEVERMGADLDSLAMLRAQAAEMVAAAPRRPGLGGGRAMVGPPR